MKKKAEPEIKAKASTPDALEAQFKLPLAEQKKLITIPANVYPDESLVHTAVQLARSARIPLWGINLIPTRNGVKPYINADGIKFRLANDARGISSNTAEVLQFPNGANSLTVVRRTITMGNGQIYQGLGAVVVDGQWNPANALLKADTKANRRAGYDAIADAVGMPMYDEDSERYIEGDVLHPKTPKTVGQLLAQVSDEELHAVGIKELDEIKEKDVPEIWGNVLTWRERLKP